MTTEALKSILARLEPMIVDDVAAAEYERSVRESAEEERRVERRRRLDVERVPLVGYVRKALIAGGLEPPLPERQGKSLRAVRKWLRKPDVPPWLFLRGRPGCGKSVAAAMAIASGPVPCMWSTARALEQSFSGSYGALADAQERAMQCALLVIDDLGLEKNSGTFQLALLRLLEARKGADCRTLVTLNMSDAEFSRLYGDPRISSRLNQQAAFVTDEGEDLRVKYALYGRQEVA